MSISLMIKGKPIEEADRNDLIQAFNNLYQEYSTLEERHKRLQLKYVKRNIQKEKTS